MLYSSLSSFCVQRSPRSQIAGDFLHGEELLEYAASNQLHLFTAFSRDQDTKVYVQHRILEHGELVWDLLSNHGAVCLVAG